MLAGDTLFLIARRFNVTLDELIAANPQITDPALIFPGQLICIPRVSTACLLILRPPAGAPAPGALGIFLLQAFGRVRTDLLVAARGLAEPATLGATAYTALLSWDRVTFDIPMRPVAGLTGVWSAPPHNQALFQRPFSRGEAWTSFPALSWEHPPAGAFKTPKPLHSA